MKESALSWDYRKGSNTRNNTSTSTCQSGLGLQLELWLDSLSGRNLTNYLMRTTTNHAKTMKTMKTTNFHYGDPLHCKGRCTNRNTSKHTYLLEMRCANTSASELVIWSVKPLDVIRP